MDENRLNSGYSAGLGMPLSLPFAPVCQAWEYLTVDLTGGQVLDDYGKEGWELVSVTSPSEDYFAQAYFKRPMGYVVKIGGGNEAK